ncbi:phospholipase C/P1 nuclease [Basidiobolus meristosporus CBS 931.73]|uniref:Phospholipase C/P1 nuclease n=1 Tax=Basidiobolus meristosporus CBS 931.73 TaxID=1314790 RepID=A0A1Y1Y115_9FUNG|nr:phospholipase C/P1 nuclease [Basidiobolus meristosporus CBS 931.73]|eukprot:ORX91406.1 phospholipase C/P1 nuclease [Basidiobolus meristosporus CBS 931.73]
MLKYIWSVVWILSTVIAKTSAWGRVGHRLTGAIADRFLNSVAKDQLASILPPESEGKLEAVASWPDQVKYDKDSPYYLWSGDLHFASPASQPPGSCDFSYTRDCPNDWCIVGALTNFSNQIGCYSAQRKQENQDAVRFVAHLVGDVSQPLHFCGRSRGGVDEYVTWENTTVDFHYVWDSKILEKRISTMFNNSVGAFRDHIIASIKWGAYKSLRDEWLDCGGDRNSPTAQWLLCPHSWALQASQLNCGSMWIDHDAPKSMDFSEDYYLDHAPVVEQQVAMAGYRIAAVLNNMLMHCLKHSRMQQIPIHGD